MAGAVGPTPFAEGADGRVEAPAEAFRRTVARLLAELGDRVGAVEAVGVAGLAESGAPVDADGRCLAPVIAWHDPRGAEAVELLQERFGDELSLRIGQPLRTVSSVAKLGWLAANGVSGVRWWLGVPELCLHALTGARATDWSLAARTGAFDVGERRYLPDVPEALGLPADVFAAPAAAGAVLGRVSADGSGWSGLRTGIPVTVAGHDHLAGLVGSGASVGDLVNSVGTAETVLGLPPELPDLERALATRVAVTLRPDGTGWAVLASGARAGLVLGGAARALGLDWAELDELAATAGRVDVDHFVAALEGGEEPEAPAAPPGEVWNGVLRALARRTWDAVDRAEDLSAPAERVVVFGGGSRSRPWLRAKAEVGRLPVWRSTASEAVARGAAVTAGVAAGWWGSVGEAPQPVLEPVPGDGSGGGA